MLQVENLTQRYGDFSALKDVSFSLKKGSITGLIGPNGAGKTTLINAITGLSAVTSGRVCFDGVDISDMSRDKIARLGIARTFQNLRLFEQMTVLEHLMAAQNGKLTTSEKLYTPQKKQAELKESAYEILRFLKMDSFADYYAKQLSYGDSRRVEIARALATTPKLMLLDEPGAGMNEEESHALAEQIIEIKNKFSVTILLIEHDMSMIKMCSEEVIVLNYGEKICSGSYDEISQNKEVIKAYLGEEYDATKTD